MNLSILTSLFIQQWACSTHLIVFEKQQKNSTCSALFRSVFRHQRVFFCYNWHKDIYCRCFLLAFDLKYSCLKQQRVRGKQKEIGGESDLDGEQNLTQHRHSIINHGPWFCSNSFIQHYLSDEYSRQTHSTPLSVRTILLSVSLKHSKFSSLVSLQKPNLARSCLYQPKQS